MAKRTPKLYISDILESARKDIPKIVISIKNILKDF